MYKSYLSRVLEIVTLCQQDSVAIPSRWRHYFYLIAFLMIGQTKSAYLIMPRSVK